MRRFRVLLVATLSLATPVVWAQVAPPLQAPNPYPVTATVLAQQAEVYSGPGPQFYPTTRLRYGDRIIVLGESKKAPGWLEVLPPPGSYSWIDAKHVKVVPGMERIGIVDAGDPKGTVAVMPGSALVNKEPNVEITRIASGAQVLLLDRPTTLNGASWYPIAPVATEVRFVHTEAVRGGTVAAGGWNTPTVPTSWNTPSGPATTPTNPTAFIATAQQADQALAAGNVDRARLLYLDALRNTTDPAWQNYLNGQLAKLSSTPAAPTGGVTPNPGNWSSGQPYHTASNPPSAIRPVDATQPPPGVPPTGPTPMGVPAPPTTPPLAVQKQWSPWGVLRSAPFTSREGQPMYVLEDRNTAKPLMYLTTTPGMSLREHLGQIVAVYGSISPRVDDYIRAQILVAEHVATPPAGSR